MVGFAYFLCLLVPVLLGFPSQLTEKQSQRPSRSSPSAKSSKRRQDSTNENRSRDESRNVKVKAAHAPQEPQNHAVLNAQSLSQLPGTNAPTSGSIAMMQSSLEQPRSDVSSIAAANAMTQALTPNSFISSLQSASIPNANNPLSLTFGAPQYGNNNMLNQSQDFNPTSQLLQHQIQQLLNVFSARAQPPPPPPQHQQQQFAPLSLNLSALMGAFPLAAASPSQSAPADLIHSAPSTNSTRSGSDATNLQNQLLLDAIQRYPALVQVLNAAANTPALSTLNASSTTSSPTNNRALSVATASTPSASSTECTLSLAFDDEQLSDYQILVRKQLEVFEAKQEYVESNTQGRKKQVFLGQVGLRCRHCAHLPLRQRGRGAVYYPAKLSGVYQAAQNMASSHLCESCHKIPDEIKLELRRLRGRRDTASGGKQYWADGCRAMGLRETENGLVMSPGNKSTDKAD
jgi:hypothetical protein